ncbi:ABC transporter ATP-binding protein [Bacillus suaedaesalsae]|uniref:ATP-binding cassette domain-containing protein n=1 Tax=Bacillus suaedaesalsae TaxID=2810349 RepID=A0ABS2DH62_9BACI|nr:ABC transporter transmembrane domain-containing protein [Bacillus suaedaesalsae]MBM6617757.1 ATP-binding cassette domain-containing protein [Bacillus suaedaesalsae]
MFSVLRKLSWFFKENWKRYTVAVSLLILVSGLEVIPPKIYGIAIDAIHVGTLTSNELFKHIGLLLLITFTMYGLTYIWMYKLFGGAFVLERLQRSKLMRHFLKMTPTFFEKNRTGDLMARSTNDLKAIAQTAGFGILTLVDSFFFMFIIIFTMGFFISWKLTLAAILPLPIMAVVINIYGKKVHKRFTAAQDAFGDLNDNVLESIAGVRVIRAYVQEHADVERFDSLTEDVFQKNLHVAKINALFDPTIKVLVGISYLIGLGYGAYLVFHQQLTLGELVSFNVYLGMLIWPMFAVGELINIMQQGNASLDRVMETLSYEEDVKDDRKPIEIEKPDSIVFKHVTFQYPSSSFANLIDVNLTLNKGETLGIVGKTGSGKTTLIKQLLREYPLGEGEILISGVPLNKIPIERIQSWIGYVPQQHILFSRTVKENILFGKPGGTDKEVEHAIEQAAFRKDLEMLPEGLQTLVGEKGVALSGGQKQRISIARALLINPEILILDDSLSAVDAKTEAAIIENIQNKRAGKTTIISTHRLSAVQHANWIVVFDEGKIVEEGTHEQLVENDGWYKEQWIRQQVEEALGTEEVRA